MNWTPGLDGPSDRHVLRDSGIGLHPHTTVGNPFVSRPRIPRGDYAFCTSESPSNNWDDSPLALIDFSGQRHNGGQGSDSSSEEFNYGAWGSLLMSAPAQQSPATKVMAKKQGIKEKAVKTLETRAKKQHRVVKSKMVHEKKTANVLTNTLVSFPVLSDEFEVGSPPIEKMSFLKSEEDFFQHFSKISASENPQVQKVSGSVLSTHHKAYSPPMPTAPNPPPHEPFLSATTNEKKTACTCFHIHPGSVWTVYIDGVKVAGSGNLDLDIDLAIPSENSISATPIPENNSQVCVRDSVSDTSNLKNSRTNQF
jgi:hypothetical protein